MKKRLFGIGGAALLVILVIVGIVIYQSLDDQTEASATADPEMPAKITDDRIATWPSR